VHDDDEASNEPIALPASESEIQGFSYMPKWRPMLIEGTKNEANHVAIDGLTGPVDKSPVIMESMETKASNVCDEQSDDPSQTNESVAAGDIAR
jgi:hypothetical protein